MAKTNPLTLAELTALIPRLHATLELLRGLSQKGRAVAAAKPRGRGKGSRRRISPAESAKLRDKLLAILKGSKAGLSLGDVVKRAGAPRTAVGFQLRRLRSARKARVIGNRGTARWLAK